LFKAIDVMQGLSPTGYLLVNSNRSVADLHLADVVARMPSGRVLIAPASEIAVKHIGRPLPNAALLGAFARLTGAVRLASVVAAIRQAFAGKIGEANAAAATEAHDAAGGVGAAA
jgi:pyruvate ferredoxin oxidoreductase gamma subunit